MIGIHTVTLAPVGGGAPVDISCLIDSVRIQHGRTDTESQPEASACSLTLTLDMDVDTYPAPLDVGAVVRVVTTYSGVDYPRFSGRVTDINQGWQSAGEDTPDHTEIDVIATGVLAELGRRVVGDTPYPQQLDGARVAAIMTTAGITLDPAFSDPGTVQIRPRDIDSQPALDVAQSAASSAGGLIWETRAGDVRYADSEHRTNMAAVIEIDACDILVTPIWTRSTAGLINKVSIGYGVAPEGGEEPRYVAERADNIDAYGDYGLSASTELAALADATAMGQLLLVRNGRPVWIMSELPVDVGGLSDADTVAFLGLDTHALISLIGLPAIGTAPTSALLWLEGWAEELSYGGHDVTLTVSGYCRTSPAPRWNSLPSSWTWDTITPPATTWDDASCFGPLPSENRWADVPASQRWDQLPPATTWDNYSTGGTNAR